MLARDAKPGTVAGVTPAVRQADHAWTYRIGHFDGHDNRTGFRREPCEVTVGQMAQFGIEGMDEQRAARRASYKASRVVHPGIVAADLSSSDQQERVGRVTIGFPE